MKTINTINDLNVFLADVSPDAKIDVLGHNAFITQTPDGNYTFGFVPYCNFYMDVSGKVQDCKEFIDVLFGLTEHHFLGNFSLEIENPTYIDDRMTITVKGSCGWSVHHTFCEEITDEDGSITTTLLAESRRLSLSIECWGEECTQNIKETVYYDSGEAIIDSTEPLNDKDS